MVKLTRLLSATALASSFLLVASASAQDVPTSSTPSVEQEGCVDANSDGQCDPTDSNETITVTGSRIARPNLDSPAPVTSATVTELTRTGDLSLGDQLTQLPQLRATFTQANSTRFIGTAGINSLDLRGLGSERTLVLVNGRRHVTSTPGDYTVDINTIPSGLLERVDIVTGGTSAVYGSDAISGVVNFVLKSDYEGVEISAQNGISSRSDRGSYGLTAIAGKNFADNRGNIALGFEFAQQEPVYFSDRDGQTGAFSGTPGFTLAEYTADEAGLANGSDGIADTMFQARPGAFFSNLALGGAVLTSCPAITTTNAARRAAVCTGRRSALAPNPANPSLPFGPNTGAELSDVYVFTPDGRLLRNQPLIDNRFYGGGVLGGQTATGLEGAMLLPGLRRINANLLFNFEVSPAFRPFAEAKYVDITANQTSTQPTFATGFLNNQFSINNPYLTEENRAVLRTILAPGATTFSMNRFNNDLGTRAEDHERKTYRVVGGVRGDLSTVGNIHYEIGATYGRTETYYESGGNVLVDNYNAATRAVRDGTGQIVCSVNADTNPGNDMPGCVPMNLFGQFQSSQAALDYVLYTSSRKEWAEQIDVLAFVSGDSSGLFKLPGGPIAFSVGGEFRQEDAFSDYDDITQADLTFLNAIGSFDPRAVKLWEGFGEIELPVLRNQFISELTVNGAARFSKYSTADKGIWAWNVGGVFAPVRDVRFRASYARAVRAPSLGDLYSTPSTTFAAITDPCGVSQRGVNPNRARNCAEAGIPTQLVYTRDDGVVANVPWENVANSTHAGVQQGNLGLEPETSNSLTIGMVVEPRFLPGLSFTIDYYDIRVDNVIAGLTGQEIVNRCYDDPVSINNPFCSATFRRVSTDPLVNGTLEGQSDRVLAGVANAVQLDGNGFSFLNQPFNYAALTSKGIDADLNYRRTFGTTKVTARALVSWLDEREQFIYITAPDQSLRINGVVGDPEWRGRFSAGVEKGVIDVSYDLNWIGSQAITSWEVQHTHQGRGPTNLDAFPIKMYDDQFTHDLQIGIRPTERFRFYVGVDNVLDTLPPYGATGTGGATGIYGVQGRFFYTGARASF